jgi:carbon monoxide dehydrogenase subunit G
MASVVKEVRVPRPAEEVWSALRDVGALHTRLVPGFVVDTVVHGDTRTVTFANGLVVRERIVGVDEDARRVAYTIVEGIDGCEFHASAAQVSDAGEGHTRFVWTADLVPHSLAPLFSDSMDLGLAAIARAFS